RLGLSGFQPSSGSAVSSAQLSRIACSSRAGVNTPPTITWAPPSRAGSRFDADSLVVFDGNVDLDVFVLSAFLDLAALGQRYLVGARSRLFEHDREAPRPETPHGNHISFSRQEERVGSEIDEGEQAEHKTERPVEGVRVTQGVSDVIAAEQLKCLVGERRCRRTASKVRPRDTPSREQPERDPKNDKVEAHRSDD